MKKTLIAIIFFTHFIATAQERIPIGQWRVHLSYNDVVDLDLKGSSVIAATKEGIFFYDTEDGSINTLTSLEGINPAEITTIGYEPHNDVLFIGHATGVIDIVNNDEVIQRHELVEDFREGKRINNISFHQNKAFISTDLGLLIYDIQKQMFVATYDGLGMNGDDIIVYDAIVFDERIFAATSEGVISGPLTGVNLNDYRLWTRYPETSTPVVSLTSYNSKLYAALDNIDLILLSGAEWVNTGLFIEADFNALSSRGDLLLVTTTDDVYKYDGNEIVSIDFAGLNSPKFSLEDGNGRIHIAEKGLFSSLIGEGQQVVKPSGPQIDVNKMEVANNILYALLGESGNDNSNEFAAYNKGVWYNYSSQTTNPTYTIPEFKNAYDVAAFKGKTYVSSFGSGILIIDGDSKNIIDDSNSPLQRFGGSINVTGLAATGEHLWIVNYGADNPLIRYDGNTFNEYSLIKKNITDVIAAPNGFLIMIVEHSSGGGLLVFNPATGQQTVLDDDDASNDDYINIIDDNVNDIVFDIDGKLWIGTASGVAYYNSGSVLFNQDVKPNVPIYENRLLFRNFNITSIAIDGGGRKWFGTHQGVWLFNKEVTEQIYNFNVDNSPLLSNQIEDIILLQNTGEVFFATTAGLISYRTGASTPSAPAEELIVFPNPVEPWFTGTVGISGVAANAVVKITDVAGNLIYQTRAVGSTASWDLTSLKGGRVRSGVYLVFTSREDGTESVVGKIAVLR